MFTKESKNLRQTLGSFGTLGILIIITAVLILAGGGYFVYQRMAQKVVAPPQINSFDDCVKAGYPVAESYPRQCRTPSRTFVEEVKVYDAHTPETDISTWQTYRNEKYGFEVKYPPSVEPLERSTLFYGGELKRIYSPLIDICFASVAREEFYCDFELFVWDIGVDVYISSPDKFFGMNHCAQEGTYVPRFGTITGVEIDVCEKSGTGELYIRNAIARKDGLVFIFSTEPRAGYLATSDKDTLFHTILSTFRFIEPSKMNPYFSLDFFAGWSIFGSNFEVKISPAGVVNYRETMLGGTKEVKKFERKLTEKEMEAIQSVIKSSGLLHVSSQDFQKEPLIPDQGRYRISLTMGEESNIIECGIPVEKPQNLCQIKVRDLQTTLNSVLGVKIY